MIKQKPAGWCSGRASVKGTGAVVVELYDARAARRVAATAAGGRGAALATLARAATRALATKQRSNAESTRASMAGAVSRITSDTSEMMRNFARSSIRFSRNERLFDLARNVRF